MKALRLTWIVALSATALMAGCKGSASDADSPDDVSSGGCPEEDPFCDEDKGGGDDTPSDSGASEGGGTTPGGSGGGIFGGGGSEAAKPSMKSFETVLKVQKGKDDKVGKVVLYPDGIKFGNSSEQIAKLYDRLFDAAYLELYKTTPIGPQTKALDAELTEKKAQLRRSRIEFGSLPTGLDNGPLKGEYSYNNDESLTRIDLGNGINRHFFFFSDRLWKIYDEVALKDGSPFGTSFETAVAYAKGLIGVDPKKIEPDYDRGINYEMAEWRDGTTLLRLYNREGQNLVAVVFVEEATQNKLPTLRRNRPKDPTAVDPSVRDVLRPPEPDPTAKDPKKKK